MSILREVNIGELIVQILKLPQDILRTYEKKLLKGIKKFMGPK